MKLSICIVGDCSTFNRKGLSLADLDPRLVDLVSCSELFIFNLEGPIVSPHGTAKGVIQNPLIRFGLKKINRLQPVVTSSEALLDVLNLGKINVACLANNHILDAGPAAISYTMQSLRKRGFRYLGAGENIQQAQRTLTININNTRIGIANYNFIGWRKAGFFINIFGAGRNKPGANYALANTLRHQLSDLAQRTDYTIAVFHIGREMKQDLESRYIAFLSSLPVDLIVTHHAHIKQNISSPRIRSCGDFIFEYPAHLPENRRGSLIQVIGNVVKEHPLAIKGGLPYLEQ